jgi:hypothetical protein
MLLSVLFFLGACDPSSEPEGDSATGTDAVDSAAQRDSGLQVSYNGPAYEPCVSDAQCGPGSECTTVPGYAGHYCGLPCDPGGDAAECDLDGTLDFGTVCLETGRCARECGEPTNCPETLDCQQVEADTLGLCAGESYGGAGFYGICTHPNVEGTDCPEESSCFGGDYIGIDDGICLPWCDDYTCPEPPADSDGTSPICYDIGLDHPMCILLCIPGSSECPRAQECLDLGGFGLCVPEGAESPI